MQLAYETLLKLNNVSRTEMNIFLQCVRYQDDQGQVIGAYYRYFMKLLGFKSKQTFYNVLRSLSEKKLLTYAQNVKGDFDIWINNPVYSKQEKPDYIDLNKVIFRVIYNSLEEYTIGSCDMLAHASNVSLNRRMIGFGMSNVPENNWEAVMVTILHYLSIRMDYNKRFQKATHLVIDETQVVSKKPGSARQLNNAVITFRKFGGIVTMALQNVTAALSNQTLIELFQNCSYKVFLDQGGVDAQSLAAIQEFSAKEFRALSAGKVGEGVIVWNKKIVLFDALISKNNALYRSYNTNFHEKAGEQKKLSFEDEKIVLQADVAETASSYKLREKEETLILQIADIMDISEAEVQQLLKVDFETGRNYLMILASEGKLMEVNGKYRKVE